MKVICETGYFRFYPENASEIAMFENLFNRELVAVDDYYTFAQLAELDDYSIMGQNYGGMPAKVNYAGRVVDVFRENALKYNIVKDKIESNDKLEVVGESANNYVWVVTGIAPAFAQLRDRSIITGYQGFVDLVYGVTTVSRWEHADI